MFAGLNSLVAASFFDRTAEGAEKLKRVVLPEGRLPVMEAEFRELSREKLSPIRLHPN
jgi:hypothetical protein